MILRWKARSRNGFNTLPFLLFSILSLTSTAFSVRHEQLPGRELDSLAQRPILAEREQRPIEENPSQQTLLQQAIDSESGNVLPGISSYSALFDAIEVMQSHYFRLWPGTWPSAIDWTAAVMGTQISATLSVITRSIEHNAHNDKDSAVQESQKHENMLNQYFTQIISFYHGENAFSLRTQAYDDMLWVVLGWLESVEFIYRHSKLHYTPKLPGTASECVNTSIWYAQQFIPQFAHRARVFYDLAAKGWDTTLCGGGMVWNPYLAPYKNAITNQLFIAASVGMYLYFPGDDNASPFSAAATHENPDANFPAKAHDTRYLSAAVTAYDWLKHSSMTNHLGLYVDGFHISGWRGGSNSSNGSGVCDVRDEKVYSYNQGVILSGLRGLYDATSKRTYLEDGHVLVRNVITATGWEESGNEDDRQWRGLGRGGVMEDACDAGGSCSQNGQTFKGIWWLHFTKFCQPISESEDEEDAILHHRSCQSYRPWVEWNAKAAYATRDDEGKFGEWWGDHEWRHPGDDQHVLADNEGTDYRNDGVPDDEVWRLAGGNRVEDGFYDLAGQKRVSTRNTGVQVPQSWDPNDRGRGRTVETQSGGLAVVRALYLWERWFARRA